MNMTETSGGSLPPSKAEVRLTLPAAQFAILGLIMNSEHAAKAVAEVASSAINRGAAHVVPEILGKALALRGRVLRGALKVRDEVVTNMKQEGIIDV